MRSRVENGTVIIDPEIRRLDASVAPAFKNEIVALLPASPGRVVVDLSGVTFVDSSGLGALVALLKRIGPSGAMALVGVQPPVAKLLALTRLDRIFEIHPTLAQAQSAGG